MDHDAAEQAGDYLGALGRGGRVAPLQHRPSLAAGANFNRIQAHARGRGPIRPLHLPHHPLMTGMPRDAPDGDPYAVLLTGIISPGTPMDEAARGRTADNLAPVLGTGLGQTILAKDIRVVVKRVPAPAGPPDPDAGPRLPLSTAQVILRGARKQDVL